MISFILRLAIYKRDTEPLSIWYLEKIKPQRLHGFDSSGFPYFPPPELPIPQKFQNPLSSFRCRNYYDARHILDENTDRGVSKRDAACCPNVRGAGAIQWSINRNLQLPYWYFGKMNYIVPLYLQSRENITLNQTLSRQYKLIQTAYSSERSYYLTCRMQTLGSQFKRQDQLPPWLLDCWNTESSKTEHLKSMIPNKNHSESIEWSESCLTQQSIVGLVGMESTFNASPTLCFKTYRLLLMSIPKNIQGSGWSSSSKHAGERGTHDESGRSKRRNRCRSSSS